MFHHGEELDVGVAHLLDVGHEFGGHVVIGVVGTALGGELVHRARPGTVFAGLALGFVAMALPATEMHLIDVEGLMHVAVLGAVGEPLLVAPGICGIRRRDRGGARRELRGEGVGIGLIEQLARHRLENELV